MIYLIYHKEVRTQRDEFEVNYYLEMNRRSVNVVYEYVGIYIYNYRKYTITLNYYLKDEHLILNSILKNFENVYNNFSETRKLAIISKYVVYTVSKVLDIPLYKLVNSVNYEANGEVQQLSINAFTKSAYKISQRFQELGL